MLSNKHFRKNYYIINRVWIELIIFKSGLKVNGDSSTSLPTSLFCMILSFYNHIYVCVCVCVCVYIYTHTHTHIFFFSFRSHHEVCRILVPRPGIEPWPLAVKAPSPNHWTAREFPIIKYFKVLVHNYIDLINFSQHLTKNHKATIFIYRYSI